MEFESGIESLKRRLAEAKKNLRLVRERMSEYVRRTDIPLQLIKDERWLEQEVEALQAQLAQHRVHIQLILEGEISSFTDEKRDVLLRVLASVLQVEPTDVRILRVQSGSIRVIVEVPEQALARLDSLSGNDLSLLVRIGVRTIEGDAIRTLDLRIENLLTKAQKLLEKLSLDEAIGVLREGRSDHPGNENIERLYLEAMYRRGVRLYVGQHNLAQARQAFREVVDIDPHHEDAARLLDEVEQRLEQMPLAVRVLTNARSTLGDPLWQGIGAIAAIVALVVTVCAWLWPTFGPILSPSPSIVPPLSPTPTRAPSPKPSSTPTLPTPTLTPTATPTPVDMPFYVYQDGDSPDNHFSFWDGGIWEDGGSVGWGSQIDYGYSDNCHSGSTCMCIAYTPTGPKYWVGINWLHPPGSYGKHKGFNLERATRLTFWARGERGGEVVTFDMGGLGRDAATCDPLPDAPHPDSVCPSVWITRELSTVWQQYSIDLAGKDLSHVIRGFFVSIGGGSAHTIHLDEIRYESGPLATMTATATLTLTPTCPYQGDTDEATIAQLIQAEAQAVNRESICIIQAIFAQDAVVRDRVSGEEWHDPVVRYQKLFSDTNFLDLAHFDILPAGPGINGTVAHYTSGSQFEYEVESGQWQSQCNGSILDSGPSCDRTQYGSDHWTLEKNAIGCWVITKFEFNAGHIPFPP